MMEWDREGAAQRGDIKINHPFLVNMDEKKKLFPKLITLYRAEIASSCSFKSINQLTLAPVNLFKELKL